MIFAANHGSAITCEKGPGPFSRFRHVLRPIAVMLALAAAHPALAVAAGDDQQPTPGPAAPEPGRPRSFELSFGGELLTPQALGSTTATLTSNSQPATPFNYFVVSGTRAAAPALRGRIGYNLTSMFSVEGGLVLSRGDVRGNISADTERASPATAAERLTQYFVNVSALAHLRQLAFSNGAGIPFLEAGAGYLRQMHEGNTASNTGQIYHFGGGVTYMFSKRPASRLTGLGLRVDGHVYVPRKGYSFDNSQQVFGAVGGSLLVAF
jgi:hypothetical protein